MSSFKFFQETEKSHNIYNIVRTKTILSGNQQNLIQYSGSNYWKNNIQRYIQNTYDIISLQNTGSNIETYQQVNFPSDYFTVSSKKISVKDFEDFKSLISIKNIISHSPISVSSMIVSGEQYTFTNSVFYSGSTPQAVFLSQLSSFLFFKDVQLTNIDQLKIQYSFPIHEFEYICNIAPGQMNRTLNLTAYEFQQWSQETKSGWYLKDTFSNTYISSIGLYNNNDELLALAKISSPIKISDIITTTVIVQIDYVP